MARLVHAIKSPARNVMAGLFRAELTPAARRGSGLHEQAKAKTRAKSSHDSQIGPIDPPLLIVASSSLDCYITARFEVL